ncbi:MAG: hypothetical protein Aureis2KO_17470 [Aureisphaera sp.]
MKDFVVAIKIIVLFFAVITAIKKCENPVPKELQPERMDKPQACIHGALQAKAMLYAIYGNRTTKAPLSVAISSYINELEKIERLPSCPMPFKVTFKQYVTSWKSLIPIVEKYPEMRGSMRELLKELEQSPDSTAIKNRMRIIEANWRNVEIIASTNGIEK